MSTSSPVPQNPATPLPRVEIGFVSATTALCDFLITTFELEPQAPIDLPFGTLYRMNGFDTVLKVLVPTDNPLPAPVSDSFYGATGMRFLTIRVADLDTVITRATAAGGRVVSGPLEPMPGVRLALIEDSDGNTYEASERGA